MAKASKIEVPGESPSEEQPTDQSAETLKDALQASDQPASAPVNPITNAAPPENEEAPVVEKPSIDPKANTPLDWSHLSGYQAMNAPTPKDDPTANLPNMADVDHAKIPYARQVLTKQGWVVSTALDPNARNYAGK